MSDLTWTTIEPSSLGAEAEAMYQDYKAAYRLMKEAKDKFEKHVNANADCPAGFEIKFGYNFGKLSVALAPVSKPKAAAKSVASLADFLKAQAASGKSA